MKSSSTIAATSEAGVLAEMREGVARLAQHPARLKASRSDSPPAPGSPSHFHDRLELRFLFGCDRPGHVCYRDVRELLLTPPQVLHPQLPGESIFAHVTLRLDEISLYYLRGHEATFTLPWGKQSDTLGLHIPAFLAACHRFCRGEHAEPTQMNLLIQLLLSTLELLCRSPSTSWNLPPAEIIAHYIQEHYYRSDLTIQEVAQVMHCSPNYIQQLFRREYNCTPIEYLIQVRLDMARQFLRQHRYRIKEVAALCGWNYVHYFDRRYRERYGHLPSEE